MKQIVLGVLLLLMVIPAVSTAQSRKKKPAVESVTGYVIGIKNCNTILVENEDKKFYMVILVGLSAINESDPMYEVCRQNLSALIANKRVVVRVIRKSGDAVIWGNVRSGQTDAAQKMLEGGWAIYDTTCTMFPAYKKAGEKAQDAEKGYYAAPEEKAAWILEAVPLPYDEKYHLWIDTKGVTHNHTCKSVDSSKCRLSFEPTKKQCEECGGYSYWRDKFRPEHEKRIREGIRPIVHGEMLLKDRVKKHIKIDVDEMENVEWYESDRVKVLDEECVYRSGNSLFVVEPYFGRDRKTNKFLFRMRTRYCDFRDSDYDADWMFYERVQFLGVEQNSRLMVVPGRQKESNVAKFGLDEWSDNIIDPQDFENLMKSQTIRVKFYGKFTKEFELTFEQYQMFEEIFCAYQSAKNGD